MRFILVNLIYIIGITTMFYPAISNKPHLTSFLIPAGIIICVLALIFPSEKPVRQLEQDVLDSHMVEGQESEAWKNETFKKELSKLIVEETWDKGIAMVYLNKHKQFVRHWKDGRIEIIKDFNDGE
jgi:hypothetical protein